MVLNNLHILYIRWPFPKIGIKNKNKKIQNNCSVFLVREKCDGLTDIVFPGNSVFGLICLWT